MSGTQSTEQTIVDADRARNASDILALIADYENEVGTVAGEPVAETRTVPDAEASKGSQPTRPVQIKNPPVAPAGASVDTAPAPVRTSAKPKKSQATSAKPEQADAPHTELDTEALIRRHQRARAQKLQREAAAASPAGANAEALYAEHDTTREALTGPAELMQALQAIKTKLADQENRLQGDRSLAEEQRESFVEGLASVRDCMAELKALLIQGQDQGRPNDNAMIAFAQGAGTVPGIVQTELDSMRKVLTETLAVQTELTLEVKAFKIHLADQERSQDRRRLAEQQHEFFAEGLACVRDCFDDLKTLLMQGKDQGQQNNEASSDSAQGTGTVPGIVQTELDSVRKVLAEALAAQTELTQELKVIKRHLIDQGPSHDRWRLPEQMNLRANARADQAAEGREGDAFLRHGCRLCQCLDDKPSHLHDPQERINDRLQRENVTGDAESSAYDTPGLAADISPVRADVLAPVKSLERPTDRPAKPDGTLEREINSLRQQLSQEKAARAQLEEANRIRDALEADLLQKERQLLKDAVNHYGSLASAFRHQLVDQKTKLAAAYKTIQQETAARRQTEEILREVQSHLLALSSHEAIESLLDLPERNDSALDTRQQDSSTVKRWKEVLRACAARLARN